MTARLRRAAPGLIALWRTKIPASAKKTRKTVTTTPRMTTPRMMTPRMMTPNPSIQRNFTLQMERVMDSVHHHPSHHHAQSHPAFTIGFSHPTYHQQHRSSTHTIYFQHTTSHQQAVRRPATQANSHPRVTPTESLNNTETQHSTSLPRHMHITAHSADTASIADAANGSDATTISEPLLQTHSVNV